MGTADTLRFEQLVTEHGPAVDAYVRRRIAPLDRSTVDDVTLEVWVVVWRRLDAIPTDDSLPWILAVARNVLRTTKRSALRRTTYEGQAPASTQQAAAEDVVIADLGVASALRALSEGDRELLLLHFWDGLDTKAIGESLGLSVGKAAVRLSRAKDRFEKHLRTDETFVSARS
jgi:RNA polymerase sigma-70 factor (ECF subfamily)